MKKYLHNFAFKFMKIAINFNAFFLQYFKENTSIFPMKHICGNFFYKFTDFLRFENPEFLE